MNSEIRQKLFKTDDDYSVEDSSKSELWQQFFLLNNKTCSKCNLEMIKSGNGSSEDQFVDVISLEAIRKSSAERNITILNLKAIKEE